MHIDDDPLTRRLAGWAPRDAVNPNDIPGLSDIEGLFGSDPVAPWLRSEVADLVATDDLLDRIAALGMIISWWKPQDISGLQWLDTPVVNTPPGRAWAVCKSLPTHITDRAYRAWVVAASLAKGTVSNLEECAKVGNADGVLMWGRLATQEWLELNAASAALASTDHVLEMARILRRVERVIARTP